MACMSQARMLNMRLRWSCATAGSEARGGPHGSSQAHDE